MRVIKNINNNVSICQDRNQQEVIAFGKGIGFCKPPYDLDISKVQRTFYDIDSTYVQMLQHIPEEMIEIAANIVDFARTKVEYLMNSSIVFTLADHLTFALQRHQEQMVVQMPMYYDVLALYESECAIGEYALQLIMKNMDIRLPKEEIVGIALHFINANAGVKHKEKKQDDQEVIEHIKALIEQQFTFVIAENDVAYSRFVSHLQYLLKRGKQGVSIKSENYKLYVSIKESFPDVYACASNINMYLSGIYNFTFDEEELLYLMLHINRLCVREDCYR